MAQIINLRKASRGPEYSELGALEDLARLQTHLAWQTLQFVMPESAPSETDFRASRPVVRVEAIENYTRGVLAPSPELKLKLLSQAVRLEPRFSQANFELGRLHWDRKSYRLAADHFLRVAPGDIRYRQANFFLGLSRYHLNDFVGAEQAFRLVAVAVPLNEVWNNLAAAQLRQRRPEALETFQKALEGDPADPDYQFNVGYALFIAGKFDEAAERFRAVLDRDPDDAEATTLLGRCLKPGAGRNSAALRQENMERIKEEFEESAYLQLKAVLEPKRQH
jgi:tetratricopeptide (TPR) repeat protein